MIITIRITTGTDAKR